MYKRFIFFALLLAGCQPQQPPSNAAMAELLHQIETEAYASPQYPYANELRARNLERIVSALPYRVPIPQRLSYLEELLYAGQTARCVEEGEKVIAAAFPDGQVTPQSRPYFDLLALAYLRLGEQNNCLDHHHAQSCIIPIREGGVHHDQSGSRGAIALYEKLLAYDSTDLQSRWLLNIAYMTVGQYPDGVPSRWVIPESAFASDYDLPYFPDVAHHKGVAVSGHAGGCSVEDFNNDSRLDIFMTSYLPGDPCRLFFQEENGRFSDATEAAGLQGLTGGLNNNHADYNNDGYVDLFVTRGGWLQGFGRIPNSLLRNNGDGTFTDVTREAGLFSLHPTQTAAWADFNLDGHLDLFVGNESTFRNEHPCELYLNNGDGTFTEIGEPLGLDIRALVKGAVWGDFNNDRLPDLYVSILGEENRLFMNRGGTRPEAWRFEEIAERAGVQRPVNSFPTWVWDFDNDGDEDIFVSGYYGKDPELVARDVMADYLGLPTQSERPRLYRNNGDETFTEVSRQTGLDQLLFAMGCNFGDIDNDGWLDAYIGTGEFNLRATVPNRMFRNAGGERFQDVSTAGGFGQIQKGHAISFGDLDNDGDQDIYTVIGGALQGDFYSNMLLENPGNDNRWVTLRLIGKSANRSAIGSKVRLTLELPDGSVRYLYRTVSTGASFGANSLQLEVGLGQAAALREVVVNWANAGRTEQVWRDLPMNQVHILTEE